MVENAKDFPKDQVGEPLFSVVIPLYNRAPVIRETLNSVLAQTCQDFEIIIVDDGSKDDPKPVIDAIGDNRIRYIYQDNAGANVARNKGIAAARGRYIAMLDSDDRFLPHHLQSVAAVLGDDEKKVVFARIIVDRGDGRNFLKPPRAPWPGEPLSEYLCCDKGFVQTSTLALHSSLAKRVHYLDWLPYGQDVDYALRLDSASGEFRMLTEPGAVWSDKADGKRISSGSVPQVRMRWANENRHLLTDKAYIGFLGWRVAKAHAENFQIFKGIHLFLEAFVRGAYPLRHAVVVFIQILLANGSYRRLANLSLLLKAPFQKRTHTGQEGHEAR